MATVTELREFDEIVDVRSPAGYAADHIPGAINCPVLDDAERGRVGTLYKQSPFEARKKIGAMLVARDIAGHLENNWPEIRSYTGGIGVDAQCPHQAPPHARRARKKEFQQEQKTVAPERHPDGKLWQPGNAPSQAQRWAVEALATIGVYPTTGMTFPIGMAMNKNLTHRMCICNHRKYIPRLIELVRSSNAGLPPSSPASSRSPRRPTLTRHSIPASPVG